MDVMTGGAGAPRARSIGRVVAALGVGSCLIVAASAHAGLRYVVHTEVEKKKKPPSISVERVLIDGNNGRIDMYESAAVDAVLEASLITRDGGSTFALIEDGKARCSSFSLDEFYTIAGHQMHKGRRFVNADLRESSVVKTKDEPGERVLDRTTRHVQLVSKLGANARLLFFKLNYELEIVDDLWLTEEIELPELERRVLQASAHTGFAYTDAVFSTWLEFVDATPLKQVSVVKLTDTENGNIEIKTETITVLEIEEIASADVPPGSFDYGTCEPVSKKVMTKEATRVLKGIVK